MAGLTAQPLGPTEGLNWIFLIELLICGILSLFFLFYFNRLFATLVSYGIRAWTWHKYRAHIDITALQVSLLGGRIFFKSIRYHAHNITVLVHDGHVTWKYWLRQVQDAAIFEDAKSFDAAKGRRASASENYKSKDEKSSHETRSRSRSVGKAEAGGKQKKEVPCRITVRVSGVEAFIYNRSPAYDGIIEATLKKAQSPPGSSSNNTQNSDSFVTSDQSSERPKGGLAPTNIEKTESHSTTAAEELDAKLDIPSWLHILPIKIVCKRAAAAVGNENTTSILTAKVEQASGQINAAASGPLDFYKLLFDFDFKNVNVAMKPNNDFKRSQKDAASQALRHQELHSDKPRGLSTRLFNTIGRSWHKLHSVSLSWKRNRGSVRTASIKSDTNASATTLAEQVPGHAQWQGLTRYLDDVEPDERAEWRDVEYAKASTLADCEYVGMRFYWDIPGLVRNSGSELLTPREQSPPPEYGLDLAVAGGFVVYGPWADRQRVNLQQVFFPAGHVDATPLENPRPGDTRIATTFKLFLSIDEDVTLRLPTREQSKDSRWQGRANPGQDNDPSEKANPLNSGQNKKHKHTKRSKQKPGNTAADARPYGWLDITVKTDSTINYTMDMYARNDGYRNFLDLDVKGTEMTSSVNHALLWRAGALTLGADLSYPISWNSLRDWPFTIVCDDLELFILRDHMFLIIDLVNDWGSGAPPEFYSFVPFRYNMDLTFRQFTLYLNTNDANIINDPAKFENNDFVTLEGDSLKATLGIPLQYFRPKTNEITFDVLAQHLSMRMLSSTRNTIKTLLPEKRVAELPELTLNGTYFSNQDQIQGLTDILRMDIVGTGMTMHAHGFFLRHLINIKENYFGDYIHFKTLEEFQCAGNDISDSNKQTASFPKPKSINELDVLLSIVAKDASVLLPTNLYSCKEFVRAELPEALVDLRVSSYYLDLAINFSPISLHLGSQSESVDSPVSSASGTQLYVSHAGVVGHRAFGLPPDEPPYASTWEIDVGPITGECNKQFLHDTALAAKSLLFTFQDRENALPLSAPLTILDVSFVQVRTDILRVWLHVGKNALLVSADPMAVHVNDWADATFSQRIHVIVPNLIVACVDGQSATRHRVRGHRKHPVRTYAFLQTSLNLNVVGRKRHFTDETVKQQAYIRQNDLRTNRTPFLRRRGEQWLRPGGGDEEVPAFDPPAMPSPSFPFPLDSNGLPKSYASSVKDTAPYEHAGTLRPKPSSISLSESIRRGRLRVQDASQQRRQTLPREYSGDGDGISQPTTPQRFSSTQTSLPGDRERTQFGLPPSTMAFSSSYAEPYFPLDLVEPDETLVPSFALLHDEQTTTFDSSSTTSLSDDSLVNDEAEQTTIMVRLEPGVRAYVEPGLALVVAELSEALRPSTVEDVMDDYQVSVLSSVSKQQEQRKASGEVTQVGVSIPSIALRVSYPNEEHQTPDVVDAVVGAIDQRLRIRQDSVESGDLGSLSLHLMVTSLSASLKKGLDGSDDSIMASVRIEDVLVWLALSAYRTVRATIGNTSFSISTQDTQHMMQLAERALSFADQSKAAFTVPENHHRKRLHFLLYQFTQFGEHVGEPPFMTRMSFVLRAYTDHFRNQESWKILMRFRNILRSLPPTLLRDVETEFDKGEVSCPDDTPQKILSSWTQWRNWDVVDIGKTVAFETIAPELAAFHEPPKKPISIVWVQDVLKIAVTDGQKESSITVGDLTLGLDVSPPTQPTGLMLVDENKRTRTLLHLHAGSFAFDIQWNLVDAMDSAMPAIRKLTANSESSQPKRSVSQTFQEGLNRHDIHVVLSIDAGSLASHSINLRHVAQVEGLRMSLIGTTQAQHTYGNCLSILVNADVATTQLYASSKTIWQSLLTSPSIYLDHLSPAEGVDLPPTVTAAIAYDELQLVIKEQLPGILNLVDSVITDEVYQIMHLMESLPSQSPEAAAHDLSRVQSLTSTTSKVNVALLAGNLTVELSLLQALKYRLEGKAASMRLAPSLSAARNMVVDFETGQLSHSFINTTDGEEHQQGLIDVPPINGHVALHLGAYEKSVSVGTTIGQIEVDAEALSGVLSIVNKPEVQNVISATQDRIKAIQQNMSRMNVAEQQEEEKPSGEEMSSLYYDFRFALLGVRVSASTPQIAGHSTADLEFGIGPLHAVASNKSSASIGDMPLFPEIRGSLRDIGATLTVTDKSGKHNAGNVITAISFHLSVNKAKSGKLVRELTITSPHFQINTYPETAATIVDVINNLQNRLNHLDLSKEMEYIRHLRAHRRRSLGPSSGIQEQEMATEIPGFSATDILAMKVKIELNQIEVCWLVNKHHGSQSLPPTQDLVLTLACIQLTTHRGHEGRLTMKGFQLQLVPRGRSKQKRSLNSAFLPEIIFSVGYWSEDKDRSLAFKASGKPLDLRLESSFIVPVNGIQRSMKLATEKFKIGTANWQSVPTTSGLPRTELLGKFRFHSIVAEADFAGAQVYVQGSNPDDTNLATIAAVSQEHGTQPGRYGRFAPSNDIVHTILRSPGIAFKLQYDNTGQQPSVTGELMVAPSSNMLLPNVVPLVREISNSVKEVMQDQDDAGTLADSKSSQGVSKAPQKFFEEESLVTADPAAIFGKTKVNLGLRISRQEFGLTCQPIAKIDAKAVLEDFYLTVSTIEHDEHGRFFAVSAILTDLSAKVKHVYSREPTFSYEMESIVLSLMNSKHVSGVNGISAILKIHPTKTSINGKQLQDLLLFREIWLPPEARSPQTATPTTQTSSPEDILVQRYQMVASAAAFPWNATVSIAELSVDLDLGQSIGKTSFKITNLWASSQKSSSREQNLCVGLDDMAMTSRGRMSGFVQLNKLGVRTSITWPEEAKATRQTPLIQASMGFDRMKAKAAFDYQAFAFGDIEGFDFLMYNVRERSGKSDRLVSVLDCDKAYVFCTATSPAQAFALYQAVDRLIQEKQTAFAQSMKDIEKHLRRASASVEMRHGPKEIGAPTEVEKSASRTPITLHTDVVVTLGNISVGAFPSTFFDSQILKLEANNMQARFAVGLERGKIRSGLGMTIGQLQVALAGVKKLAPKSLGDITVDEIVSQSVEAKGGIILRVPRVIASMETWQVPNASSIEYIFKSLFEGKVDIGWNLNRINFIRGMWTTHSRALAARLGKPLPESAVKITAGPQKKEGAIDDETAKTDENQQQKITAEVSLPQSRYEYTALEPPVIETPQLRDMGEATPPLEWIGLHRDRLPNVTHQIIIVSLLEVAKEVEDAYERILGSSSLR